MVSSLPVELLLLVIAHIDKEEKASLNSFSQTSSAFLDLCQRFLLSRIVITDRTDSQNPTLRSVTPGEHLIGLLRSSPRLIPYVKEITISDASNPWDSWLRDDLKLVEALHLLELTKIERFELRRNHRGTWLELEPRVRWVIVEICRSPALVGLSLWYSPLQLLNACGSSLKYLRAHECQTVVGDTDIASTLHSCQKSIESFRVYHSFDLARVIQFLFETPNQISTVDKLREVHITASTTVDYSHMRRLFRRCRWSLEKLTMGLCTESAVTDLTPFHFGFPGLAVLTYKLEVTAPNAVGDRLTLPWLATTLCGMPERCLIHTIRLELSFDLRDVPGGLSAPSIYICERGLRLFGDSLGKPKYFPRVKSFEVEVYSSNPDDVESIREWVLKALTIPQQKKMLKLKILPRTPFDLETPFTKLTNALDSNHGYNRWVILSLGCGRKHGKAVDGAVLRPQIQVESALDNYALREVAWSADMQYESVGRSALMASDEETPTQLDAQTSRSELDLSELRRRENSLSPISRLPPEIFCKIFVSSTPEIYYGGLDGRMRPQAMDISHVCHSWRVIAIACPELWGNLHINLATNAEVLTLALERAGRAPVSINVRGWTGKYDPPNATSVLSKFIRERQSQCQHLTLHTGEHSFQKLFKDVSGSFSNLLSLKYCVSWVTSLEDNGLLEFLQHSFPRLLRLEIAQSTVPCDTLQRFPQLTHVDIQQLSLSNTVIADLLAWLKQVSAGLQILRLREKEFDFLSPTIEAPFPMGINSIHLLNLEVFDLQSCSPFGSRVFEHFLSSISIPTTSRLRVIKTQDGERTAVLARRAYGGNPAPVVLEFHWQSNVGKICAYNGSSTPQHGVAEQAPTRDRAPWIDIRWPSEGSARPWEWEWSFAHLRVLKLGGEFPNAGHGDAKRLWTFLAENAVALEILQIASFCVERVAIGDFLQCLRGSRGIGGSRQVPWPTLRELHSPLPSEDYGGHTRTDCDDSTTRLHPEVAYALDLADALRERYMSGSGSGAKTLAELYFTADFSEPLDAEFALILSSAAAKVVWAVDPSRGQTP
ncbi:hypothetical protein NMY22_g219 [Coprinellus aureogranulatus]|nr:hypothetical protein NMY22_g219 [Coprinellus aureogranulatus]